MMKTEIPQRPAQTPRSEAPEPRAAITNMGGTAKTAEQADAPTNPAPVSAQPTAPQPTKPKVRDGFIDALRALALVRVTVWHALGIPIISWVLTTMPVMFFVAGSLLCASLERGSATTVLRRRLRRFLVPFWLFGAIVLSTLALVNFRSGTADTHIGISQLFAWIVPLINPTASSWEAGWASSPLWYMRAYLWILLLSPAIHWCWRRSRATVFSLFLLITLVAHVLASQLDPGPNAGVWILGDLGIYGFFTVLGFAHHHGAFDRLSPSALVEWLCVSVIATIVAWRLAPSPDGVINHSYPALLTYGCTWICVSLLVRPWLSKVPQLPVLGAVLHWMTRRAMSIYLWHSPCIVGAYWLLTKADVGNSAVSVLALTAVLVVVVATLTGWIEDTAGGRQAELVPLPHGRAITVASLAERRITPRRRDLLLGVAIGTVVAVVATSSLLPSRASAVGGSAARQGSDSTEPGLNLPPAPSGRPDPLALNTDAAGPAPDVPAALGESTASLDEVVDQWRRATGIDGVELAVSTPGAEFHVTSGSMADAVVPVTSITKTMTATIALQLVDEGLLSLDGPLPPMAAIDPSLLDGFTVRNLLNHSSGLTPYQQSPSYDPTTELTPDTALRLSLTADRDWQPGASGGYSNAGFLLLGALIEEVTGTSFETQLQARIFDPVGLTSTALDTQPKLGWVGGAAGGVTSTVDDLLIFGSALYRDQQLLAPTGLAEMTTIDARLSSGLGAFPICPCTPGANNTLTPTWVGHNGGSVTLQFSPSDGVLIAASFSESFWTDSFGQADVHELLNMVRSAIQ